jgi:hypothetical protein
MANEKCEQEMGINETKRMPLACEETLKDRRWETAAKKRSQLNPRFAYCPKIWTHQDRHKWGAVKWGVNKPD